MMETRTENVKIRFTKAEKAYLKRKAQESKYHRFRNGHVNFSEYLRESLLENSNYKSASLKRQMLDLQFELRKIGVNVNQIAKKINAGFGTAQDLKKVNDNLQEIQEQMERYLQEVEKLWRSQY